MVLGKGYCNVSPAWPSWTPTVGSLAGKHWKFTMEKNGATSRIKPSMACFPGGGFGALPPQDSWLFPQCYWPLIESSWCTVCVYVGCKRDRETLKVHYGEEWSYIKYQTRDGLLPRWMAVGSTTPAPVIIPLMLLALYSVLTMYCMYIALYGVHCMVYWGRVKSPHIAMSLHPGLL